jgi:hypothetical protein
MGFIELKPGDLSRPPTPQPSRDASTSTYEFEQIKGEVVVIFEKQIHSVCSPQMTYLLNSNDLDGIVVISIQTGLLHCCPVLLCG